MNIFTIREALIRNSSSYHHGLIPFPEFNCWRHVNFFLIARTKDSTDQTLLPNGRGRLDDDRGIINAENALKTANDELVEKGIVTSSEKMSIHFLVDVEEENLAGGAEMTDQESVDLVIAAELEENCEGGLEGGEEEAEIELRPAERTMLKEAISALDAFLRFAMNGYSGPTDLIYFEDEARRIRRTLVAEQDAARIQTTMR
ncbi:BQ5605_C030g10860 [Microbotryum silenes-dioicae]|uniref:BQ5605_C030g10860 protein n=1 Tax=Microbotryum silenes-dioicae TaxID=796604 RepID=A0A2X0PCF6_9BASI|nr:BQ5605_C030g10860 [Microbotryum silenes-dioicae]